MWPRHPRPETVAVLTRRSGLPVLTRRHCCSGSASRYLSFDSLVGSHEMTYLLEFIVDFAADLIVARLEVKNMAASARNTGPGRLAVVHHPVGGPVSGVGANVACGLASP